ncbi:hypothetical protein ACS0TY_009660 [Phlomoides rotata]
MGTELVGPCFKGDNMDIQSIPSGFESLAFDLKRREDTQVNNNSRSASASIKLETPCDYSKTSSSWHGSRLRYNKPSSSTEQIEFEQDIPRNLLPKGVVRGCEGSENCQKVMAEWRPEEARRPDLEEAPVFYPSEEEFEDTLNYISSIRPKAERYGICRIVPPSSWTPPCPLKEKNIQERSTFSTRIQRVDKLQNRDSMRKIIEVNNDKRKKRRRCLRSGIDHTNGNQEIKIPDEVEFGFEPGQDFTLDAFQKYDYDFKAQYFKRYNKSSSSGDNRITLDEQQQPTVEDIEGEYWRIVEKPTDEIEVLYGADLNTGTFGSGFPKNSQQVASASDINYINSGWNLNNFARLPGSVLSFESSDISGVVVPWLYIGMCFSSFCWHVEDHHMYSLNYMHWGYPKMWYGVPESEAVKLEAAMRKCLPDLFEDQPDLLHKLVTQLSPSILKSEGVPVYRCVQNPGEFVLTFPRAYHGGFNCGFNCAEAVNIAPVDWLPHGQNAVELYREQGRRTSISHDKLLLGAAREAVKADWEYSFLRKHTSNNLKWKKVCGKNGILSKTLKTRVEMECMWREVLCESSQVLKMESSFDANNERECIVCLFDLHLSAVGCHHCSPDKYACLKHAKQLCSCSWDAKFFLFRYEISELNMLVEALEGKLSSIYRWARFDMGFALSSCAPSDKMQTHTSKGSASEEICPPTEEQKKQVYGGHLNSTKDIGNADSYRAVVLALESAKASNCYSQKVKSAKPSSSCKEENSLQSREKIQSFQASEVNNLEVASTGSSDKSESTLSSISDKDVIVLSDDESDEECPKKRKVDGKSDGEDGQEKLKLDVELRSTNNVLAVSNPSSHQNNLDGHCRRKGPRIAKVVRRINCKVEPLDFGTVHSGELWCDSGAIYPKGFRSRVEYIDIDDPTNMCHYVSEILDVGLERPLFMVYVEHNPNEVFAHTSASSCWELVRNRVNNEIIKQHKLGRGKLPPLQPPGSLNGMEMFDFSSPAIVQEIQSMDQNRVCTEYWRSRALIVIPIQSQSVDNSTNFTSNPSTQTNHMSVERILDGLFEKANLEELHALYSLLKNKKSTEEQRLLNQLLDKINKQSR